MSVDLTATHHAITAFPQAGLAEAGRELLATLGYRSAKTIALDGKPANFAREIDPEGKLKKDAAKFEQWREVQFLFQLTNDEIPMLGREQGSFAMEERFGRSIVDSFVFLAIALEGEDWNRGALAGITRAVNGLFPMPVIILFRYGDKLSIAVSERRAHKRDLNRDVQTGRISIILGISTTHPHRGHLSILRKLEIGQMPKRPSNFDDLYKGWLAALSTKTLNESFYRELSHWFFWAKTKVTFPEGAGDKPEVPLIRLLTRVIFCWFIKERGLIPETLFRTEAIAKLLKADPASHPDNGNYYRAILQNLFFATLNTEMGEGRKWRSKNSGGGQDGHHMIHSLYRYQDHFADPDSVLELFRTIPFLNGGLFECLDRELSERDIARDPDLAKISDGKRLRVDGFSDHPKNPLHVPNHIFFGEAVSAPELNKEFDTKGKAYTAKGLFTLFDDYVFTVEENTSAEEEVALDPELLGKVFENLLASYNPETDTTARKKSGSFYTPRYVVDYMVRETLAHQFTRALMKARPAESGGIRPKTESLDLGPADGELAMERPNAARKEDAEEDKFSPRIRALLDPAAELPAFTDSEKDALIAAIEDLKILDPACGSGAFPMGMLQALMEVLKRLDPKNARWKARNLKPYEDRIAAAEAVLDATRRGDEVDEARKIYAEVKAEFEDEDLADYVRKLHLIEKCLYGSDIQPIAILIAKLRFFISLAVEQKPHPSRPNLGIKPLPNLETKLVAANSLIPLERPKQMELYTNKRVDELQALIEDATQRHFGARTMRTKRKYRELIQHYRDELSEILETEHSLDHEDAKKAACWNPFDQNASAPFFDPLWMFQMHDGFDIVIGNPPYVRHEKFKDQKAALERIYGRKDKRGDPLGSYSGTADYLVYFIERGIRLLKEGGAFSYITSNQWFSATYGEKLRFWITHNSRITGIIDFGDTDVFEAVAYPTIICAERRATPGPLPEDKFRVLNWQQLDESAEKEHFWTYLDSDGFEIAQASLEKEGWLLLPDIERELIRRMRDIGLPLGKSIERPILIGIKTALNEAFVLDEAERQQLLSDHPLSAHIIKPFIRGRDIKKYHLAETASYLIQIESSDNKTHPWSNLEADEAEECFKGLHPGIYERFSTLKDRLKKRSDKGRFYWELRSCSYWNEFERPKIVWPDIANKPQFCLTTGNDVIDMTAFMLPEGNADLVPILNSSAWFWYFSKYSSKIQNGYYRFKAQYCEHVPIPKSDDSQSNHLHLLNDAMGIMANPALEQLLNGLVYELYFPDDLHARGLHLFDAAHKAGLDRLSGLEGPALTTAATTFASEHLAPGQPLRIMLSDLQTLDVVRIIEGKA